MKTFSALKYIGRRIRTCGTEMVDIKRREEWEDRKTKEESGREGTDKLF